MKLNAVWEKMLFWRVVANFENERISNNIPKLANQYYEINIPDKKMFNDLQLIFMQSKAYKKLYLKIFSDFSEFNFVDCSSVTDNYGSKSIYGDIKLYDHLIRTYNKMLDILRINKALDVQQDVFLLIALLHDIGKSHELCKHYLINTDERHDIRSAYYFKSIIENDVDNDYKIDESTYRIIYNTLIMHHDKTNRNIESNIYHKLLVQADQLARKEEENLLGEIA